MMSRPSNKALHIGGYRIDFFRASFFKLDGGAMFGIVPKPLWRKTNPADDANRIELAANIMLLRGHDRTIIVDTGIGHHYPEKFKKNFAITSTQQTLDQGLKSFGLKAQDISDVFLTHLHFDHTGGSVTRREDGTFVPRFPQATYHIQQQQWDWAHAPSHKDRGSYHPDTYLCLHQARQLRFLNGDQDVFPHCKPEVLCGHSPGMQGLWVEDDQQTLFYAADLFPLRSQIKLPYIMAYDIEPLKTAHEKERILKQLEEKNGWIAFSHDPYCYTVQLPEQP